MTKGLQIKWRPSKGRGEYEYLTDAIVNGKRLVFQVPGLETEMVTDVKFRVKSGKKRLRRDFPNDRKHLNAHALVAAMCALPTPSRTFTGEGINAEFDESNFVVEVIDCRIVSNTAERVVLRPISLHPRGLPLTMTVDVERRIESILEYAASIPPARNLLRKLSEGSTLQEVDEAANAAFAAIGLPSELSGSKQWTESPIDDIYEPHYTAKEGAEKLVLHRKKERKPELVRKAKQHFAKMHGGLFCECCGTSFEQVYGALGRDFIEAHHRLPLSQLSEAVEVQISDLAMLCSNCHRMVHRPKASLEIVSSAVRERRVVYNEANLKKLKR